MIKFVTARELGKFLRLSESTIYKLARDGQLPGFRIGDSWRFDMNDVTTFINNNKKKEVNYRNPNSC